MTPSSVGAGRRADVRTDREHEIDRRAVERTLRRSSPAHGNVGDDGVVAPVDPVAGGLELLGGGLGGAGRSIRSPGCPSAAPLSSARPSRPSVRPRRPAREGRPARAGGTFGPGPDRAPDRDDRHDHPDEQVEEPCSGCGATIVRSSDWARGSSPSWPCSSRSARSASPPARTARATTPRRSPRSAARGAKVTLTEFKIDPSMITAAGRQLDHRHQRRHRRPQLRGEGHRHPHQDAATRARARRVSLDGPEEGRLHRRSARSRATPTPA